MKDTIGSITVILVLSILFLCGCVAIGSSDESVTALAFPGIGSKSGSISSDYIWPTNIKLSLDKGYCDVPSCEPCQE